MTILALEISAEPGVLGVVRDTKVIAEFVLHERHQFSTAVASLFGDQQAADEISAVAVGIGPGSFTGLRVALSFAKGLALARSLPLWPLSSHAIYAANVREQAETIAVISHARRGQCHLSRLHAADLREIEPRAVVATGDLPSRLDAHDLLTGPALSTLEMDVRSQVPCAVVTDQTLLRPAALVMAELARTAWQHKQPPDTDLLLPDYGLEFGTM